MKPKKAARILKSQDRRFDQIGGEARRGWYESPDRVRLCLAAPLEEVRLAKARYDAAVTGTNPGNLAKQAPRQLSPDERFDSYLAMRATRDRGAAELLEKRGGAPAGDVLGFAERLQKGSSGEGRRLGEAAVEEGWFR